MLYKVKLPQMYRISASSYKAIMPSNENKIIKAASMGICRAKDTSNECIYKTEIGKGTF